MTTSSSNQHQQQPQKTENIVLELLSDKQLLDLQTATDLLFSGKIAMKNEGGFKQLYDLPPPALIDRCSGKYICLSDVLSCKILHYGWLCHRDSGWAKNLCIFFADHGLLFIYVKPTKGYVIKLSFGLKMEVRSYRKAISPVCSRLNNCLIKVKLGFGAVEFSLNQAQAEKWRQPLMNAFDDRSPYIHLLSKTKEKDSQSKVQAQVPVSAASETLSFNSTMSTSQSEEANELVSLVTNSTSASSKDSAVLTCSDLSDYICEASSLSKIDSLLEDYQAIKIFLQPLGKNATNSEITMWMSKNDAPLGDPEGTFGDEGRGEKCCASCLSLPRAKNQVSASKSVSGVCILSHDCPTPNNCISKYLPLVSIPESSIQPSAKNEISDLKSSPAVQIPIYDHLTPETRSMEAKNCISTSVLVHMPESPKKPGLQRSIGVDPRAKITEKIRFFESMARETKWSY